MNKRGELSLKDLVAIGFGGVLALLFVILKHNGESFWALITFLLVVLVWWVDFESSNSISTVFLVSGIMEIGLQNNSFGGLLIFLSVIAFVVPRIYQTRN